MLCESCGTENRAGSRFCDHCGSPLSLSCPACGVPNRADALFCASCGTSLAADTAPAAASPPTAERRQVSVLFADLVGFTTFAEGRDPERVRAVQQRYFDVASQAIARHGGTVEKFIGDAVMAVWGTPVAHEDDAQRAVRAGLEVVKAVQALGHELDARAAVVTAEAAVTMGATNQGMVAGDMVNTASRLQTSAEPGEVLADAATRQAAESAIAFDAVSDRQLKGKALPVPAWSALRAIVTRSGAGVEPPFVGRVDELRRLKDLLHAVGRDRRIRLVSLTGPAGIGKSRLVDELRQYAEGVTETFAWHTGRSPSYGEGIAFWALGEMVRRRAGLAEGDDEETTRERLAATLSEFVPDHDDRAWIAPALLALLGIGEGTGGESLFPAWRTFFERVGQRGTVVLVFEDLQWADSGTIDFIEHLMDWSRTQPILIVTLARPELLDTRSGWGTGRSNATSMALEPMSDAEMRELLEGVLPGAPAELAESIVGRAEGMPLYAVEMVRALLTDGRIERRGDSFALTGELDTLPIPASLRSLIGSRLDALDADARSLLQHAAVLGQAFAKAALTSLSGRSADELESTLRALVRREFFEIEADPRSPERGQYRFVQSLIREVAYDTLGLRERRTRHLAAARYLETTESDEAAGALATHYLAALHASDDGPEADAVAAQARISLRAAAERAAGLGAHAHAVENLRHALGITTDPADRADLLVRAASSAAVGAVNGAAEFALEAVEAYRTLGDQEAALKATALLGDVLLDAARVPDAVAVLTNAAASLPGDAAGEGAASVYAMLSRAQMRMDDNDASIASADRALVLAERQGLHAITTTALINKASALSQLGRRVESEMLLDGAVHLAHSNGWSHIELRARGNLAMTLTDTDPMRALEMLSRSLEAAERIGDVAVYGSTAALLINTLLWTGRPEDWERAEELIQRALPMATPGVDRVNLWINHLFPSALRGRELGSDLEQMDRYVDESTDPRAQPLRYMARAWGHYAAGRWGEAAASVRAALEIAPEPWPAIVAGFMIAVNGALTSDHAAIARIRDEADNVPTNGPSTRGNILVLAAIQAAAEGRSTEAVELFLSAASSWRDLGVLLDLANAGYAAATVMPDEPRLRPMVAEAKAIFDGVRAEAMVRLIDRAVPEPTTGGAPIASRATGATESPTA